MKRIFWVLAAALYAASLLFAHMAEQNGNGIYLLLDRGVTAAEAAEISRREHEAEEPLGFCFYALSEDVILHCPDTGRTAQVTAVSLYGNGGLLGAEALSWQEGCLLDEQTAQTLFGTGYLGAQEVLLDGKTRAALGTVPLQTPTALVSAGEDAVLDRCILAGWDENGAQMAGQFLLRHGLTGEILNFYPLLIFTKNLTLLPLWALLVLLCRKIGDKRKRLALLAALAGAVLLGSRVIVPKNAIPSMWSDFSFWGSWFQSQRENLTAILMASPGEWALQMELDMVKSVICTLAGTLAAAWGGRRAHHASAAH